MALEHEEITREIIGAAFEVHRILGYGFLEKVYQKSMGVELEARGLKTKLEDEIHVKYKGVEVGFYKSDLFVNDCVIVEIKAAKEYNSEDESQLLNELKGTGTRVGLLINFGRAKVEFKRFVY